MEIMDNRIGPLSDECKAVLVGHTLAEELPIDPTDWMAPDYVLDWMNQGLDRLKLTPKERQIGVLILKGYIDKEIADTLGNSEKTIKSHTGKMYKKIGCRSRTLFCAKVFGL